MQNSSLPPLRLCKDCLHFRANPLTTDRTNLDKCMRPGAAWVTIDYIHGHHVPAYAQSERECISRPDACGYEAKHFQPHPDTFLATSQESSHVSEGEEDGNPSF